MTVSVTSVVTSYTGDGSTTAFPTVFVFNTSSDIEVIERVIATGAESTKALTTDYTVSGGAAAGAEPATGTVTAVTAPAATVEWHIRRVVAETQSTDLPTSGSFDAAAVETMVDRATMQIQQHSEELGRTLSFPKSDSSSLSPVIPSSVDRASNFLAFDASGNPIASAGTTGTVTVSSFMETVLDDSTAAAGRTTLGAAATGANTFTGTQTFAKGADIASATSMALGTDGNYFDVTGTTTIATITGTAGAEFILQFDGSLTMTDSATLDLGGNDITVTAGDRGKFVMVTASLAQLIAWVYDGEGMPSLATQAQQEAGTSNFFYVSPSVQHFHPSAIKASGRIDWSSGVPTLDASASYNITSIGDTATGRTTVTIATDFSGADEYVAVVGFEWDGSTFKSVVVDNGSRAAGSFVIESYSTTPALIDPGNGDAYHFICTGDL